MRRQKITTADGLTVRRAIPNGPLATRTVRRARRPSLLPGSPRGALGPAAAWLSPATGLAEPDGVARTPNQPRVSVGR